MAFNYCPRCGTAFPEELREVREHKKCAKCGYVVYRNSKPCVAVLIEKDGRVMLTKRKFDPKKDMWDLPGGFLEDGEHPEDGARREILEETGLYIDIVDFLGIEMDSYEERETGDEVSTLNFHYLAYPTGGEEMADDDVAAIQWFLPGEIPSEIAFENCRVALDTWRRMKLESVD